MAFPDLQQLDPVVEQPDLPGPPPGDEPWAISLISQLRNVFRQYGFTLNQLIRERIDVRENSDGVAILFPGGLAMLAAQHSFTGVDIDQTTYTGGSARHSNALTFPFPIELTETFATEATYSRATSTSRMDVYSIAGDGDLSTMQWRVYLINPTAELLNFDGRVNLTATGRWK